MKTKLLSALATLSIAAQPSAAATQKLWANVVQLPATRCAPAAFAMDSIGTDLVVSIAASAVGNLVDAVADYLNTDDVYLLSLAIPLDAGFAATRTATTTTAVTTTDFSVSCMVVNVGEKPVVKFPGALSWDEAIDKDAFSASPVVVAIALQNAALDPARTAIAGRVTYWKYAHFVNPSPRWFRNPERLVALDVELKKPDASSILKISLSAKADELTMPTSVPASGAWFPWVARPTMSLPAGSSHSGRFGPINMEVTLKETAYPSWFGKLLGGSVTGQKAALQQVVQDKLNQALDPAAAAQASLALLAAANTSLVAYQTAYDAANTALANYNANPSAALKQVLALKRAMLSQQEALTRQAFDKAGLSFVAFPDIPLP
jgi:hypothetical protein